MDIEIFHAEELQPVLRALRAVAIANDAFTEAERDFVQTIAHIHHASIDVEALAPIALEELATILTDPHRRKRAVQLAIVMALVEGAPDEVTERAVRALASALGIAESGLDVLYDISHGHTLLSNTPKANACPRSFRSWFTKAHADGPRLLRKAGPLTRDDSPTIAALVHWTLS